MNSLYKKGNGKDYSDRGWMSYLGLGMQLAATVVVMIYIGVWLDKKFDTYPLFIIIFSFLGVALGLYNFIKTILKSDK